MSYLGRAVCLLGALFLPFVLETIWAIEFSERIRSLPVPVQQILGYTSFSAIIALGAFFLTGVVQRWTLVITLIYVPVMALLVFVYGYWYGCTHFGDCF